MWLWLARTAKEFQYVTFTDSYGASHCLVIAELKGIGLVLTLVRAVLPNP